MTVSWHRDPDISRSVEFSACISIVLMSWTHFLCTVRDLETSKVTEPCQRGVWTECFPLQCWKGEQRWNPPFGRAHKEAPLCWTLTRSPWNLCKLKTWALNCNFYGNLGWGRKCIARTLRLADSHHLELPNIWLDETWARSWLTRTWPITFWTWQIKAEITWLKHFHSNVISLTQSLCLTGL